MPDPKITSAKLAVADCQNDDAVQTFLRKFEDDEGRVVFDWELLTAPAGGVNTAFFKPDDTLPPASDLLVKSFEDTPTADDDARKYLTDKAARSLLYGPAFIGGHRKLLLVARPGPVVVSGKKLPSSLPWTAEVDGEDLVVRNIKATCFGGADDAGDNGETESGIMNNGSDPKLMGVALPIRSTEAATRNSPLAFKGPHIPWRTPVRVWREKDGEAAALTCILIDNGPRVSEYPTHALDLNPPAALYFSPDFDPKEVANKWGGDGFSYRIIGGAKWIS